MSHCIQCQNAPAKWQERQTPKNIFCGRICQIEYHFLGLKTKDVDDPEIIGLQAQDGTTRIMLSLARARELKTVNRLLDDATSDDFIPLPSVDGPTLLRIQEFLETGTVETNNLADDAFSKLLMAANYLDFERLIHHLMPEWVNQREFPGPSELKGYIPKALYFFNGNWYNLRVNVTLMEPFLKYIRALRLAGNQWQICFAVKNGELAIVKRLLQIPGVDPAVNDNYPIAIAAENGNLELVELLLSNPLVNPAARRNNAVVVAAKLGHSAVVERLLRDPRVNPADRRNAAIREAAKDGRLKVVELLLKDGRADPSAEDSDSIQVAARNGHLAVVEALLRDGRADSTREDSLAIHLAAQNGHLEIVKRLLQVSGVNPTDALEAAAIEGYLDIVEVLLEDGRADLNVIREIPWVRDLYERYRVKRARLNRP